MLRLELRPELAEAYKSRSQQARILTESWAGENLYCPACPSDELLPVPRGEKVKDFACPDCGEAYQLKSKGHTFGNQVANSAYDDKIDAIRRRTNPSYLFLQYDPEAMKVVNLFGIPRHFMFESAIQRRKPLSERARRYGWVGSVILLRRLPEDARIYLVAHGREVPRRSVRDLWKRFSFMLEWPVRSRGWAADVLACVRQLGKEEFRLDDVYEFEDHLRGLHPENRNIRPKIRQQLQVLRDCGVIEFLGRGAYRVMQSCGHQAHQRAMDYGLRSPQTSDQPHDGRVKL